MTIPDLPEEISKEGRLRFYDTLGGNLSEQGSIHIKWWTHRQNPSICWICDQQLLITKLIALVDSFITKSAVDIETGNMSENGTDIEIENEGSIEPEYDCNYDEEFPPDVEGEIEGAYDKS